jgi:hypothetical protein
MRRILYISLLVLVALVCNGQVIILNGYVTDAETGLALKDINIKPNCMSSATTTNYNGFFSVKIDQNRCEITFSHISYYPYTFHYSFNNKNKDINIKLKPKSHLLGSIEINSEKIVSITKSLPVYVKDYAILNNKILLLTYFHKKTNDARLMLVDQNANVISEKSVLKPDKLFKDCFGETYLITDNNAAKLEIKLKEITYKESLTKKEFEQSYGIFDFAINNKIYFSSYHYKYFIIKYHFIDLDDESYTVNNIITIKDQKKIDAFERDFNFFYYAKRASSYGMSVTSIYNNLDLLRASQPLDWEDIKCRYSPLQAPFCNVNDTICIFNSTTDSMELYTEYGKKIKNVAAKFLSNKNYKSIIRDEEAHKVYALYKTNNIYSLSEININTGETKSQQAIPGYAFIENIKVSKNEVFFLYKKNINEEYKQLYRMPLE